MLHAGQRGAQLGDHGQAVKVSAAKSHAVAGNQHLGFDLLEAVQHRVRAHVGRANAPHAADAHGRQKRHHRLGNVRQIGRHPVARLHALRLQVQGERRDLLLQLRPSHLFGGLFAQAFLVVADDGGKASGVGGFYMAKHLLRVVARRASEPFHIDHPRIHERRTVAHGGVGRGGLQSKIIPNALPKGV